MDHDASHYRAMADRCRRLAGLAIDEVLIEQLERVAAEYETEARTRDTYLATSRRKIAAPSSRAVMATR
jgi:hypothetical protein